MFKHMEIEEHTAEKPVGDRSNKGRNQKFSRICCVGHNKCHAKGKVYRYKCLCQKKKKTRDLSRNLMVYLKHLEKQEKSKPKSSRWREIIKIRAEINEIKTKEIYKESMKQKFGSLKRLTRSTNP
jgi:phosphorylcholine metabolism protein LicD